MTKDNRHNYEYDVYLEGQTAPAKVVRMVGKNKKVLEIGAGPGSITKHLVKSGNCIVTALEIDQEAIKKLSEFTESIYSADLNSESWPNLLENDSPFEVIVAADVLEHLYDPWTTLRLMKNLLTKDGHLVISLPHIGHNAICACLLNGDFNYRDWGLLDRTHIRFFGLKNIQAMFESADLAINQAEFVIVRPEETEFAESWKKLPTHVRNALSENKFGSVYQVVIKASRKNEKQNHLNLLSIPIESLDSKPHEIITCRLRVLTAKYLPTSIKTRLKKILNNG